MSGCRLTSRGGGWGRVLNWYTARACSTPGVARNEKRLRQTESINPQQALLNQVGLHHLHRQELREKDEKKCGRREGFVRKRPGLRGFGVDRKKNPNKMWTNPGPNGGSGEKRCLDRLLSDKKSWGKRCLRLHDKRGGGGKRPSHKKSTSLEQKSGNQKKTPSQPDKTGQNINREVKRPGCGRISQPTEGLRKAITQQGFSQ